MTAHAWSWACESRNPPRRVPLRADNRRGLATRNGLDVSPREIVWNRQPFDSQIVALVIRDAERRGFADIAWDDGRPFLIGIRTVTTSDAAALEAWRTCAAVAGHEIRDERASPDVFAQADANNARAAVAARIDAKRRETEARRAHSPMDAGSLFDEVRRNTQELF